jgi:hypothetical protein
MTLMALTFPVEVFFPCGHNILTMGTANNGFVPRSLSAFAAALLVSAVLLLAPACATISPFSEAAYERATSLKVESLALMELAVEPFEGHEKEVRELVLEVEKAYEFARGRPRNEISARQWEILADPDGNLLGGFLSRWERESALSNAFVAEAKRIVADAFDTIIGLESGKVKPLQVN